MCTCTQLDRSRNAGSVPGHTGCIGRVAAPVVQEGYWFTRCALGLHRAARAGSRCDDTYYSPGKNTAVSPRVLPPALQFLFLVRNSFVFTTGSVTCELTVPQTRRKISDFFFFSLNLPLVPRSMSVSPALASVRRRVGSAWRFWCRANERYSTCCVGNSLTGSVVIDFPCR